jgi:hypothetical protein
VAVVFLIWPMQAGICGRLTVRKVYIQQNLCVTEHIIVFDAEPVTAAAQFID